MIRFIAAAISMVAFAVFQPTSIGASAAPKTAPTTTAADKSLSNGCTYGPRGVPTCGTYVGAAHGSNSDPSGLESTVGRRLAVHRTYYTGSGVSSAVTMAKNDLAAGRLPWISFKLPYSWSDMVAGRGDAWARDLASRFAALKGPVWVAFHHEPETDGDIQVWRKMQERLVPIIRYGAPNVAFTVILTGWHELYGETQYRLANIWPRGVKIDVAGFDVYQKYGVVKNGVKTTSWTDFANSYYKPLSAWAASNNTRWALGETGITNEGAEVKPGWINQAVDQMTTYGGIAFSYFDSSLNSVAPWTLGTQTKVNSYKDSLVGTPVIQKAS